MTMQTALGIALAFAALWLARKGYWLSRLARRAPDSEWREEKEQAATYAILLAVFAGAAAAACFLEG